MSPAEQAAGQSLEDKIKVRTANTWLSEEELDQLRQMHPGKWPCDILKEIRSRSGLTQVDVVKNALKPDGQRRWKSNVGGSYAKFENPSYMKMFKVPSALIESLIPLFVGRGTPRVEASELGDISDAVPLSDLIRSRHKPDVTAGFNPSEELNASPGGRGLVIRYKVEPGIFMDDEVIGKRDEGTAPFLPRADLQGEQMAALVVGDLSRSFYPNGAILHLSTLEAVKAGGTLRGARVIVRSPRGNSGLSELIIGKVASVTRDGPVVHDDNGTPVIGEIEAVVIASYIQEL